MLKQNNHLSNIALLVGLPLSVIAAPIPKATTLPCIFANPGFSEVLISKNPYRFLSRRYTTVEPFVMGLSLSVGTGADSTVLDQNSWTSSFYQLRKTMARQSSAAAIIDAAGYFTPWMASYVALGTGSSSSILKAYALVFDYKPWNIHVNAGKFALPFGSGASDYPFADPFTKELGVSQRAGAGSINIHYKKIKAAIFGFMPEKQPGLDVGFGASLHGVWQPPISFIDHVNAGVSVASSLPLSAGSTFAFRHQGLPGADIYFHVGSGAVRVKGEAIVLGNLGKDNPNSKKPSKGGKFGYIAYHGEAAYRLPFKRSIDVVGVYSGHQAFFDKEKRSAYYLNVPENKARVFVGVKTNIIKDLGLSGFKELNGAFGYRHDLKSLTLQLNTSL